MKKRLLFLLTLSVVAAFSTAAFAGATCNANDKKCSKGMRCRTTAAGKCCKTKASASKDPTAQEVVIDPVCGMDVKVKDAKYSSQYKGKTYYFCSAGCKKSFDKDPAKYIGKTK